MKGKILDIVINEELMRMLKMEAKIIVKKEEVVVVEGKLQIDK